MASLSDSDIQRQIGKNISTVPIRFRPNGLSGMQMADCRLSIDFRLFEKVVRPGQYPFI
jgi:hypothetical protein